MATTVASDFKIYHEYFMLGQTEVIRQNVNVFNAAARGAITLQPRLLKGHFAHESFFTEFVTDAHRDITSVDDVAATKITDDELVAVKVNRRQGPHQYTVDSLKKKGATPQMASTVLGRQSQTKKFQTYANLAASAAVAAITAIGSALVYDGTAAALTFAALSQGRRKYGDAFQNLVAVLMHGAKFHDLVDDGLTNYKIENVAGMQIVTGDLPGALGLTLIVTDSDSLVTSGSPDEYHTVLLPMGAIAITESESQTMADETITGKANIIREWQLEYAFNLGLRGFKWDTTNGGVDPEDSELATGSNWDQAATDVKSLAGVLVNTQ